VGEFPDRVREFEQYPLSDVARSLGPMGRNHTAVLRHLASGEPLPRTGEDEEEEATQEHLPIPPEHSAADELRTRVGVMVLELKGVVRGWPKMAEGFAADEPTVNKLAHDLRAAQAEVNEYFETLLTSLTDRAKDVAKKVEAPVKVTSEVAAAKEEAGRGAKAKS